MDMNSTETQPVVTTTALRAYPGWVIRHRPDNGMFWAVQTDGIAIGPGETSFEDALYFVRHGVPPMP